MLWQDFVVLNAVLEVAFHANGRPEDRLTLASHYQSQAYLKTTSKCIGSTLIAVRSFAVNIYPQHSLAS